MKIILELLWMAFEVGHDRQDHLGKRDLAVCRGTVPTANSIWLASNAESGDASAQ
jgi:hypothetical protein